MGYRACAVAGGMVIATALGPRGGRKWPGAWARDGIARGV